ncbi:PEP-CTERM sorting domain-containing protein [Terrimicrobium sacchariphilum]|uniref:PEP-CTERM sorting domain-containing protein n=1 Tax=Terrimicrobium sacchariphilum TaxID=690879 RepID=UPI0009466C4C|nr:PEP-CTERM sorting domain-containing protein [Terrimicrobium sacchariphilum]
MASALASAAVLNWGFAATTESTPGFTVTPAVGNDITATFDPAAPGVTYPGYVKLIRESGDSQAYTLTSNIIGPVSVSDPNAYGLFFISSDSGDLTVNTDGDIVFSDAKAFNNLAGALGNAAVFALGESTASNVGAGITFNHSGNLTVNGTGRGPLANPIELLPTAFRTAELSGIQAVSTGDNNVTTGQTWAGGNIQVTTDNGSTITMTQSDASVITAGISASSAAGPGTSFGSNPTLNQVGVSHTSKIDVTANLGAGIFVTTTGAQLNSPLATGGTIEVHLYESVGGTSIRVNDHDGDTGQTGVGIYAVSEAYTPDEPNMGSNVSGGQTEVDLDRNTSVSVGNADSLLSIGVLAVSAGTNALINPYTSQTVNKGGSGYGGTAAVTNDGTVSTRGKVSVGIAALSLGGAAQVTSVSGSSGQSSYLGSAGSTDGGGGTVSVTNGVYGQILTLGEGAHAILAISSASGGLVNNDLAAAGTLAPPGSPINQLTGTWEDNNTGLILGNNSSSSTGHDGGSVTVNNWGLITTGDGIVPSAASIGILAQSLGGGGGNAGGDQAALFIGDKGGKGGNGGLVHVNTYAGSTLETFDVNSVGVLAQSIGGGGGNGANAKGIFVAVGGRGGQGGSGGVVNIDHAGSVTTLADHSSGIIAQSIGGGGGHGGAATTISPVFSAGIGGKGGSGGAGGTVSATLEATSSVHTYGNNSAAVHLQSVGGGGGTGGAAMSDSAGGLAISIAVGGHGGTGGNGGEVSGTNLGTITTGTGISTGAPSIDGSDSYGLFAQSVGGGGGHGGSAIAKSLTSGLGEYPSIGIDLALGGFGGTAGNGSTVGLQNEGSVTTWGDGSHAVFAQSVGGGGGSGGDSTAMAAVIDSGVPEVPITIAHGGNGGGGGNGGDVTLSNETGTASITTHGQNAAGLFAQSIGGGGGNGGIGNAVAKTPNLGPDTTNIVVNLGLGGKAGGGGDAGFINLSNDGTIQTSGSGSQGILAQAIGGGGGNSGGGSASGGNNSYEFDLAIGATGPHGGSATVGSGVNDGYSVLVTNSGSISTTAGDATGIHAQSIGGGGGNGGTSDIEASTGPLANLANLLAPATTYASTIAVGGKGGTGGQGGAVKVDNTSGSSIATTGTRSHGVFAQSISGGGGTGGAANATSNSAVIDPFTYQDPPPPDPEHPNDPPDPPERNNNYSINASVGGAGGDSHAGGQIDLTNEGSISTSGYSSQGLFAQSIGGGGGVAADGSLDTRTTLSLGVRINGASGESGSGGAVTISNTGSITTSQNDAYGVFAQSIGGGGGLATSGSDIPFVVSPTFGVYPNLHVGVNLGINLNNNTAVDGGKVAVTNGGATSGQGIVHTQGDLSMGLVAQSVGGGGGKAGTIFGTNSIALPDLDVRLGADKGYGNGDTVTITLAPSSDIRTGNAGDGRGFAAYGIVAQSIGGGGGLSTDGSAAATGTIALGGSSSDAKGDGNTVTLQGTGLVSTQGEAAHGVVLQSIGGGGGIAVTGSSLAYQGSLDGVTPPALTLGGTHSYGHGGTVSVDNALLNVSTAGDNAFGVVLQSIGGGGGIATSKQTGGDMTLGRTGTNDDQQEGGAINATFAQGTTITTTGDGAHAIVVQSIGGGGGIANPEAGQGTLINVFDQEDQSHGYGGETHVSVNGTVSTSGVGANGILAQVIGGGGGLQGSWAGSTGGTNSSTDGSKNGTLTITQTGTISATGTHSIGIFAQNVAGNGSAGNDITITVNGSVSGTDYGIRVDGGKTNHIQVNGSVSGGIYYTTGNNLNVTNAGTVTGNISLNEDATGTFTNEDTGIFNTGTSIVATVSNMGTLLVGGDGSVTDTYMTGHYTQSQYALMQFDVLSSQSFDQFIFSSDGHGTFDGALYVMVANNGWDLRAGDTLTLIGAAATGTNTFTAGFLDDMAIYGLGVGVDAYLFEDTDHSIKMSVTAVPEPATTFLMLAGGAVVFLLRRRMSRRQAPR